MPEMPKGYSCPAYGTYVIFKSPSGIEQKRFPFGYNLVEESHLVHVLNPEKKVIASYGERPDINEILKDIDADLQRRWKNEAAKSGRENVLYLRNLKLYLPPKLELTETEYGWHLYERLETKERGHNKTKFNLVNSWSRDEVDEMTRDEYDFPKRVLYAVEAYLFLRSVSDGDPQGWVEFREKDGNK